jgi:trehalose 6-phosphate synthase
VSEEARLRGYKSLGRDADPPSLRQRSPRNLAAPKQEDRRLIVVSNRLPVTISKDDKGEYHFKMSSGGLVSALSGCKKTMSFTWSASFSRSLRH